MKLGCTQNTLQLLHRTPMSIPREISPFLCWDVETITRKDSVSLLVVNEACRSAFLLYNPDEESLMHPEMLILDGIRELLTNYGVGARWKKQYLDDCRKEIIWTDTCDPETKKRIEQLKTGMQHYSFYLTASKPYQDSFTDWAAVFLPDCFDPLTCLVNSLDDYYGDLDIPCRDMALIKIRLRKTDCIRILRVPLDLTLYEFHQVIQHSFCWKNYHTHCFYSIKANTSVKPLFACQNVTEDSLPNFQSEETLRESEQSVRLRDFFGESKRGYYLYDSKERWIHELVLVQVEPCSPQSVCECILAVADAPPEDISGVGGYPIYSEVMGDLLHPAHLIFLYWSVKHGWRLLDMTEINEKLFSY